MDYPVLSLTWGGWVATFAGELPDAPGTHRVTLRRPTRPGQPVETTERTTADPTERGLRRCILDHVTARQPAESPHDALVAALRELRGDVAADETSPVLPDTTAALQQADPTWFARLTSAVSSDP